MLDEYETFCKALGMSERTIRLRLQWLRRAEQSFELETARRSDLLTWLARHQWKPETRKSARNALRSFYRWATEEGRVDHDPTVRIPAVKVPPGVPRPAPTALLQRALLAASPRDQLMIGLAAFAGMRVAEVAALPWSAIEDQAVRVTGKGGRTRVVPLLPSLAAMLTAEQNRRRRGLVAPGWRYAVDPASPYVLPSHLGGHVSPYTVGKIVSAALGPRWTAHTLRHRFATKAYAVERDLLAVQQLCGWSNAETARRYIAVPQDAARAAVAGAAA